MVVDDDLRVRETLVDLLREAGYEVQSAADGAEAVRLFDEWKPDVVLTDMFMPVMDGLELIIAIRRLSNRVGIIAMSGVWQRSGVMDQAIALGAAAALLKPIDFKVLCQTVEAVALKSRE
jgi:two-component system response regulator VanR